MIHLTRTLHSSSNTAYWGMSLDGKKDGSSARAHLYLTVEQRGTQAVDGDGSMLDPVMEDTVTLRMGPDLSDQHRPALPMSAHNLRNLASEFIRIAERIETGTHLPQPKPSRLLFTDAHGDTMFMGNLDMGKRLALLDRTAHVKWSGTTESPVCSINLCDDPDDSTSVAEWGGGRTLEEAWRYALGAYFGPDDDDGYDEQRLIAALAAGTWDDEQPLDEDDE